MLTSDEQSLCNARSNVIDYDRLASLHPIGGYVRRLPVSMARMMENAYDWEHLPYIHASSFSSIDLVASGGWGWRAKVGLPDETGHQLIDLLVDSPKNYWATTVIAGPGEGVEIHTTATSISDREIEIDVRFYLPAAPEDPAREEVILSHLTDQYRILYDEDVGLMSGRQTALDDRLQRRDGAKNVGDIRVGVSTDIDPQTVHVVDTPAGRMCVRRHKGRWIAHSAVCPHLLGPLAESPVDERGDIVCPWHGYRFNVGSGENRDGKCKPLAPAPEVIERDGVLYLSG